MAINEFRDLLTQRANVRVRRQEWSGSGGENLGDDTPLYSDILCLVVPIPAEKLRFVGLTLSDEPKRIYFERDKLITEDPNGQRYVNGSVRVEVGEGTAQQTYVIAAPQDRPFQGLGVDIDDHIQVLARRKLEGE